MKISKPSKLICADNGIKIFLKSRSSSLPGSLYTHAHSTQDLPKSPCFWLPFKFSSLSLTSNTGNKQVTSAAMAGSPHPSTGVGAGSLHISSPVTPPSSVVRKFSSVPPTSSSRVELLQNLASGPSPSIPLTPEQVGFCQEALSRLSKKLNISGRGRRRIIDQEFDALLSDRLQVNKMIACTSVGRLESNLPKNRYLDVLPYDDTRVILEAINHPGLASTYINASYVVDSTHEILPKFIATQGPLPNTNADFWEMVVQQQCPVIVMLTGLVDQTNKMVKCDNYFPAQSQESLTHGRFKITNKCTKMSENSVIHRLLEIDHVQPDAAAPIPVLHMQLDWPDYGIPSSTVSVREMFKTLYKVPSNFGPFVVHCSAGIGRTGTYCTIDHTLRRILLGDTTAVDLESTVRRFRQQRLGMVQTREQYAFCYTSVIAELQDLVSKSGLSC